MIWVSTECIIFLLQYGGHIWEKLWLVLKGNIIYIFKNTDTVAENVSIFSFNKLSTKLYVKKIAFWNKEHTLQIRKICRNAQNSRILFSIQEQICL